MSGHQSTVGGGAGAAPVSRGMGSQSGGAGVPPPSTQNMSQQNLNQIVIEYLVKKGYNRTEQVLRQESANIDSGGRPLPRDDDHGAGIYAKGLRMLMTWYEQNLDIYQSEIKRVLWPVFAYSYLEIVLKETSEQAEIFLKEFGSAFEADHRYEIQAFQSIKLPIHVRENKTAKLYRNNRYLIPLNKNVYFNLITFLESNIKTGGNKIIFLLQTYCEIKETDRGPIDQFSFEAIINQSRGGDAEDDIREGIPGAFTGVSNKDIMDNNAVLRLGMMPMEPELYEDVRAELQEEDAKNPPNFGQISLVDEFTRTVKREDSIDAPSRTDIPLPPSRARDVVMEVQKVKENRDRFRIESRNGGVGPAVSICMFTFHNTLESVSCMEFSDDTNLVAVGTMESYIRVWHLHGDILPSLIPTRPNDPPPSNSRRLIGHSAPVFGVSFSPSILGPEDTSDKTPSTAPKLLLSSSADKTVRLWSLETWTCLIVYKGHEGPVWKVKWSPFGHYFATCGWDKTVRVWAQDKISYLRMMVGHDTSVGQLAWHPNGVYVFSASDETDKTVRMWSFATGECVRIFPGHTEFISALECSPNGKILASADGSGSIIFWDLAKGTQIKRCKGHARGGIWSISFSVESTVLTSGGSDGTVRIWDVEASSDPQKGTPGDGEVIGKSGQSDATRIGAATAGPQPSAGTAGVGGKKKGKDTTITPDQISAFPTKKTPVLKVKFTRMNLIMAGGCYRP